MDSISDQEASQNALGSLDTAAASTNGISATFAGARSADGTDNTDLDYQLETFTGFPNLPLELRRKVWENFMPGPRVIEIWFDIRQRRYVTDAKVPTILHICSESRSEALETFKILKQDHKVYDSQQAVAFKAMFEAHLRRRKEAGVDVSNDVFQPPTTPAMQTYIDYAKDTLYMPFHRCKLPLPYRQDLYTNYANMSTLLSDLANAEGGCQIQHVAFDWNYTRNSAREIVSSGPRGILEKLVTITLVYPDRGFNEWYYSNGKLVRGTQINRFKVIGPDDKKPGYNIKNDTVDYMSEMLGAVVLKDSEGNVLDLATQVKLTKQLCKIEVIPADIVRHEEPIVMSLHG